MTPLYLVRQLKINERSRADSVIYELVIEQHPHVFNRSYRLAPSIVDITKTLMYFPNTNSIGLGCIDMQKNQLTSSAQINMSTNKMVHTGSKFTPIDASGNDACMPV